MKIEQAIITILVVAYIIISMIGFNKSQRENAFLKQQLHERDSINLINIRNHQIDSTQNAKAVYSPGVKGVVTNTIE